MRVGASAGARGFGRLIQFLGAAAMMPGALIYGLGISIESSAE